MAGSFSPARRAALLAEMNGHCGYCGRPIALGDMQVDHIRPQSAPSLSMVVIDGQPVSHLNHDNNLLATCAHCNHFKGSSHVESFRRRMKKLHFQMASLYLVKVARQFGIVELTPFDGQFYFEKIGKTKKL